MKKYLIIISVIAILLCFGTVVAAPVDTYSVETATDTLVISGKIDGYKEGNHRDTTTHQVALKVR